MLLEIEEPHMYNVDDAIAKIDGYVISISGGGPFVGERHSSGSTRSQDRRLREPDHRQRWRAGRRCGRKDGDAKADYTEPPVAHASEAAVESVVAAERDRPSGGAGGAARTAAARMVGGSRTAGVESGASSGSAAVAVEAAGKDRREDSKSE